MARNLTSAILSSQENNPLSESKQLQELPTNGSLDDTADDKLKTITETTSRKLSDFSIESIISRKRPASYLHSLTFESGEDLSISSKQSRHTSMSSLYHINTAICKLESHDLWRQFDELGTEMIITKSGRRMFPLLRLSFSNLDPSGHYLLAMDIVPVDKRRYRYAYHRSSWLVASGRADSTSSTDASKEESKSSDGLLASNLVLHPDGSFTGEQLMRNSVSFERVKLTNNTAKKKGYIILESMHKYQPRIHLFKIPKTEIHHLKHFENNCSQKFPSQDSYLRGLFTQCPSDLKKTFTFAGTNFIAVTAYQNQLITKLKIDCNPFAKGFRDSSRLINLDLIESSIRLQRDNANTFESISPIVVSHNQSKSTNSNSLLPRITPNMSTSGTENTTFNTRLHSVLNPKLADTLMHPLVKMNMRIGPSVLPIPPGDWPTLAGGWPLAATSLLQSHSLLSAGLFLNMEGSGDNN